MRIFDQIRMVIMDSFEYILAVAEEKNMTKAA